MESNLRQSNSRDDSLSPDRLPPEPLSVVRPDTEILELPTNCDFLQNLCPTLSATPLVTNLNQLIRPQSVTAKIIAASAISWNNHSPTSPPGALAQSWALFRQAFSGIPDLLMRGDSLDSAQAITMMVMHMRQSADTQTTALLLSMASRMQCLSDTRLWRTQPATHEQTFSHLFWTTFILDMEMSSNTGLPPAYTNQATCPSTENYPERDWIPARSPSPPDLPVATTRQELIFRLRASLAQIQQKIGIKIAKSRLADLSAAESDLEEWRQGVPVDIRPDWRGQHHPPPPDSDSVDLPAATLQLAYYNTLAMLCWEWARTVAAQMMSAGIRVGIINQEITGHGMMARYAAQEAIRVFLRVGGEVRSFVEVW